MVNNVADDFVARPQVLESLRNDSELPLYEGCSKYTRLSATLKIFNLKAKNGWSDVSFTELLTLVKDMLPEDNTLPNRCYEAKKVMCPMGIDYEKIHACPNDCILYRNSYKDMVECPMCKSPRYKLNKEPKNGSKGTPSKVLWYLPPIPRFQRLFASSEDSNNMRWHAEKRVIDTKMRHPADSLQWAKVDNTFPTFGAECRNLRIGLSTDGVNPHGNLSTQHSTWPVILVIYNLPPRLTMKRKYMMLSLLISGPRQPGNDIDVYLAPLIEDLKLLWNEGVRTFDASRQEYFNMRAMLMCTINDFPAYGNLSGYSIKGYKACPICGEETHARHLKNCRKMVYMGHRRFLSRHHPYRRKKAAFNGETEHGIEPRPASGDEILQKIQNFTNRFGKPNARTEGTPWKKRSIFFDLPYWHTLDVRHCIDVMHVEKNICDSLIGTLLNIPGKTKDGLKARLDMLDMNIRTKLAPQTEGKRTYLPITNVKVDSSLGQINGLPIPHGEKLKTTRDAEEKADLVAWPKHLVEINPREYTMRLYYHLPPASNDEVENYSIDCRFLHDMYSNLGRDVVRVRIADELFGDDYTSIVGPDDVRDIFALKPLSNSHCDLYISSLYDQMLESEVRFGFFNHTAVSPSNDVDERIESFVSRLNMPDKDRNYCYFMPYINATEFHWMLCVIFPNQGVVHWFNSSKGATVIHRDAKALVDSGLQRYYQGCNPRIDRQVEWKIVKSPKQPTNSNLCGYYVLRNIRDIMEFVRANNGAYVENFDQVFPNGTQSYELGKVQDVRDEIAAYLYNYLFEHSVYM
ncbi:hypothetical protein QQ045_025475 [Rhodiola kirilowii]